MQEMKRDETLVSS